MGDAAPGKSSFKKLFVDELVQKGNRQTLMKPGWYEKLKHAIRFWLLRRLPACKQTVEIISQSFERPLSLRERVTLKVHLWICVWCQWYLEHLEIMRNSLREKAGHYPEVDLPSAATLSSEARERIKRRISGGN